MGKRFALIVTMGAALCGCASQQARETANSATCQRWGSSPGTKDFVECMILLGQADALVDERNAAQVRTVGNALQGFSAGYNASRPQSLSCTTHTSGTFTYTDCN